MNTVDTFIVNHCLKGGEIKLDEANIELKSGMESIKEKIVDNKIVVIPTDKTNKLSALKPKTYKDGMQEHVENDRIIDKKELNKVERILGEHSKSSVKIFKIGDKYGQLKRAVANSVIQVNGQLPILKGADKDHKKTKDNEVKIRAILNTMNGPKRVISEVFSDVKLGQLSS